MLTLRVALPVPLPTLFDYLPPAVGEAQAGSRVRVPFGKGEMVGVVVDPAAEAAVGAKRLKPVLEVLDPHPLLDAELLSTLAWAADYWQARPVRLSPTRCRSRCANHARCRQPVARCGR